MGTNRLTSVLVATLLTVFAATTLFAQQRSSREEWQGSRTDDDWQGERPTPPSQQPSPFPAPQKPTRSGKQVLEIPSQRQQESLEPPRRQAELPPRSQPELPPRRQNEDVRAPQAVTVTVTNPQGGYIPGLQRDDFTLYEDGVPQEITYFNTGDTEPVSLGLIVDTSGSMKTKIERARQALRRFIESIRPRDEVFIAEFNQQPSLLQDFTDSRTLLMQAVSLLRPVGGTSLYDAVLDGLRRVKTGQNQKKALIVVTDGIDTGSFTSLDQVTNAARRSGVLLYTIGIGNPQGGGGISGPSIMIGPFAVVGSGIGDDRVDSHILRQISSETGGEHFLLNPADVMGSRSVLDAAVQAISRELRQQYTLGYRSTLPSDRYRSVRVETRRDDVVVRTQKGHAAEGGR
ncbi:MAG: VWA domain-containing protein [Deltaproteobacteria bacterium]|nr:VWA domain-containing protein [Deltaproteobacteria bacterium]